MTRHHHSFNRDKRELEDLVHQALHKDMYMYMYINGIPFMVLGTSSRSGGKEHVCWMTFTYHYKRAKKKNFACPLVELDISIIEKSKSKA